MDFKYKRAPSGPPSVFRKLTIFFGMIALLLSFWAGLLVGLLGSSYVQTMLHADGYRPETFTIDKLVYFPGLGQRGGAGNRTAKWWAEGTINGQTEKFTFGNYVKDYRQARKILKSSSRWDKNSLSSSTRNSLTRWI